MTALNSINIVIKENSGQQEVTHKLCKNWMILTKFLLDFKSFKKFVGTFGLF